MNAVPSHVGWAYSPTIAHRARGNGGRVRPPYMNSGAYRCTIRSKRSDIMRAMVLSTPAPIDSAPLHLCDLPIPEPGSGEVRVRVEACGICRTDLHVVEGELPPQRPQIVPGHQV